MQELAAEPLRLHGVILMRPRKFEDSRGYFVETYNAAKLRNFAVNCEFVQDNEALSNSVATVRGLHFQLPPMTQAKLVRVVSGAIFDVAVDIRAGSPTYGQWCGATLTSIGGEQLFIPRGFAHAYCTLEPRTLVAYKVDAYYAPECDAGLLWNDTDIGINWPVDAQRAILSEKDRNLPRLHTISSPFELP